MTRSKHKNPSTVAPRLVLPKCPSYSRVDFAGSSRISCIELRTAAQAADGSSSTDGTGCQFQADYLDHVSFAVEHVSHHVAGGPALAGGIVVPAVGGYGVDPGRESGSQIPITLGGGDLC